MNLQLHQYLTAKSIDVFSAIANRKVVYLDLNYWIKLRQGKREINTKEATFFEKIQKLYTTGKCIFPVSEITLWEILKQSDLKSPILQLFS